MMTLETCGPYECYEYGGTSLRAVSDGTLFSFRSRFGKNPRPPHVGELVTLTDDPRSHWTQRCVGMVIAVESIGVGSQRATRCLVLWGPEPPTWDPQF